MSDIRELTFEQPAGSWAAVELQEGAPPAGPWAAVQAQEIPRGSSGAVTLAFRPRLQHAHYRALWVAQGGSRGGLEYSGVVRLPGAQGGGHGPVARIGGSK